MAGFTDRSVATHFKVSLTGETVFFFRVWLWPSPPTGYVITSDDDIEKLKSHLATYYTVLFWVTGPVWGILGALLVEVLSWSPHGESMGEIGICAVAAVALSVTVALVFRTRVLEPIIRKYPTAHAMMEFVEAEETATVRFWRRFGIWLFLAAWVAGGIWSLRSGEIILGAFLLISAVLVLYHHRLNSGKPRTRGPGTVA